jgi:Uma2 family endonuclease
MAQTPVAEEIKGQWDDWDEPSPIRAVAFLPSGRDDYIASAHMTFEEYLALDYEYGLAEWVDGEVRLYMSAYNAHQRIIAILAALLGNFAELTRAGQVLTAGYAMRAARLGNGREPDVMFIRTENAARMQEMYLHGPADIAIEVISKDSVKRDREEKFEEYAADGVPEHWVIDPRPKHENAEFFVLRDGVYEQAQVGDGIFRSEAVRAFGFERAGCGPMSRGPSPG